MKKYEGCYVYDVQISKENVSVNTTTSIRSIINLRKAGWTVIVKRG